MVPQCVSFTPGSKVYVRVEDRWAKAQVTGTEAGAVTVRTDQGKDVTCKEVECFLQNIDHHDEEDMTRLAHLHEPGVLFNLETRYLDSNIYTFTGNILIAINPFAQLPNLYGPTVMEQYKGKDLHDLPPHIYATVANAYRQMVEEKQGQAILVTGESGAGKTETSKVIMRYLAHLGAPRHAGDRTIEQKVLESNPILEAFGNAKTVRNDNSSRFGKYLELHFDAEERICGAVIRTYLLERSRVVNVNNPERNYHIFYQLCLGAPEEERQRWRLQEPAAFHYLNQSTCYELPGVSHQEEYQHVRSAMLCVGITAEQQEEVMQLAAAVLHLGNVSFLPDASGEGSLLDPEAGLHLEAAAALFGVDPQELLRVLTTRSRNTFDGVIVSPLPPKAAAENRDSLAKVVYARLFRWLVAAINRSIKGQEAADSAHTIGLLDIYGFESFATNDFEQLCINLANEKLQQHFNQHVFKWEQAEYEAEGISWQYIEFKDNQDVLDLIEGRLGILDHLDEQCRFPQASASDLAHKLFGAPQVVQSPRFTPPKSKGNSFQLSHYAGPVNYQLENFLDKNKDFVVAEHQALLYAASTTLLHDLFPPEDAAALANGTPNGKAAANGKGTPAAKGGRSGFQFVSVGSQFRQQLGELASVLEAMSPHYVRCIKPNPASRPLTFDNEYVLGQLKCGGVMEAVRISCAGFAYKRPFPSFVEYFWQLKPSSRDLPPMEAAALILSAAQVNDFQVGKTKVFLRGTSAAQLEAQRTLVRGKAAVQVQRHFRGFRAAKDYRAVKGAALSIQTATRGWLARREAERRRRLRAAVVVQSQWRGARARGQLAAAKAAAVTLQSFWRALVARRQLAALREERAALSIQTAWRAARARAELQAMRKARAALLLQSSWRGFAVRRQQREARTGATRIQRWWRGRQLRASFFQNLVPLARRYRAARIIQEAWRNKRHGSKIADRFREAVLTYHSLYLAAIAVQRSFRLRRARKGARRTKLAARLKAFQQPAGGDSPVSPHAARASPRTNGRFNHTSAGHSSASRARDKSPSTPPARRGAPAGDVVRGTLGHEMKDALQAEVQDSEFRSRIQNLRQWWQQREVEGSPAKTPGSPRAGRTSDGSGGAAAGSPRRGAGAGAPQTAEGGAGAAEAQELAARAAVVPEQAAAEVVEAPEQASAEAGEAEVAAPAEAVEEQASTEDVEAATRSEE